MMHDIVMASRGASRRRLILLGSAGGLAAAAALVGIADNLPGILLVYLAGICLVIAVTPSWRHPRRHFLLFVGSGLGFVAAALLHNVFEALAAVAPSPALRSAMEALGVAFFLGAIILCPAGMVVGAVGGIASLVRRRASGGT